MLISYKTEEMNMFYIKLQIGCLLVILYIVVTYVKVIRRKTCL